MTHEPATCNYTWCGIGKPEECPYVSETVSGRERRPTAKAPEHEHQYTIPVEWHYYVATIEDDNPTFYSFERPNIKRVVRLRCVCGDEVDRKPTTT